jgi:hypothetical protein
MSTITLTLSPYVFVRLCRTMTSFPLWGDEARDLVQKTITVVDILMSDERTDDNEWRGIEVPEAVAQVFMRGTILMAFHAANLSKKFSLDNPHSEIAEILLDSCFAMNREYAVSQMEMMSAYCSVSPGLPFKHLDVLTFYNKPKENYENN